MDEGGSRDEVSFSEEDQWRGPQRGAPLLGTLGDMLRKVPDMDISFHRGPFMAEGNLESGRGLIYRGLWKMNEGGHLSLKDSMKGTWRVGCFTGDPERCQVRLWKWASASIGPHFWGTRSGALFVGPLREGREKNSYLEEFL